MRTGGIYLTIMEIYSISFILILGWNVSWLCFCDIQPYRLCVFRICQRIVRCCWGGCWSDCSNVALTGTPVLCHGSEVINEMSESESTLRFLTATAGSVRKLCLTLISMPASFTLCSRSSRVWERERENEIKEELRKRGGKVKSMETRKTFAWCRVEKSRDGKEYYCSRKAEIRQAWGKKKREERKLERDWQI